MKNQDVSVPEEKFVPKGALAFFAAVLVVMASIWLVVYLIMIKQA